MDPLRYWPMEHDRIRMIQSLTRHAAELEDVYGATIIAPAISELRNKARWISSNGSEGYWFPVSFHVCQPFGTRSYLGCFNKMTDAEDHARLHGAIVVSTKLPLYEDESREEIGGLLEDLRDARA